MNPENTVDKEIMIDFRETLSTMIEDLDNIISQRPEYGAEVTLALRHLQDARMRLGVALTIMNGENPWEN